MDISQTATLPLWDTTSSFPWLMIRMTCTETKDETSLSKHYFRASFFLSSFQTRLPNQTFLFHLQRASDSGVAAQAVLKKHHTVSSSSSVLLHYCTVAPSELISDVYPRITLISCSSIYYSFNCVAQICVILLRLIIELCYVRPSARAAVVVGR